MVSGLAIVHKVCGFLPGRGDGFIRLIKVHSTSSVRGEIKLWAPFRNILRYVK
jgi:hypothetical protein